MYYSCSENKDADQLRGYREADLRLCFRMLKAGFPITRLIFEYLTELCQKFTKCLIHEVRHKKTYCMH